jgi:hypothetical protein
MFGLISYLVIWAMSIPPQEKYCTGTRLRVLYEQSTTIKCAEIYSTTPKGVYSVPLRLV